ncbi:plasmid replication protein RepC [Roseinatronobacter alkalisoli]|uniref:Plasmid replication protein RepC n=1 Tax=Roseinatronobacter alkalisoli TaxID=3028235 RepID=A0ABT5TGP4_9RHOB|nr:plasmid replication protein RepC [Roseinatronobacter sp. HJB301]MDD7973352.1 plasmid replication protein RepC [Roseinatronobacter sp. HJB301]
MAFIQAAASITGRNEEVLSADNTIPERHIIIETLRKAATLIGLNAPVIATLDAMLSCLPPRRSHHTVFASNATLTFRRNGISDRTIRRHAAILQDVGLLIRRDSPNKKRFTRHNSHEGKSLRFGFDLSPLFQRLPEIASIAADATQEEERKTYLRAKIRCLANEILRKDPENPVAANALRALRRKLSLCDCEELMNSFASDKIAAERPMDMVVSGTTTMATKDGQNVRHHHKSNKEHIDRRSRSHVENRSTTAASKPLSVPELIAACPDAVGFSLRPIETINHVVTHARTLAPMIGIDQRNYQAAEHNLGVVETAATIWALIQLQPRIQKLGAYFRAITSGSKSAEFDPTLLVRRLARTQKQAA